MSIFLVTNNEYCSTKDVIINQAVFTRIQIFQDFVKNLSASPPSPDFHISPLLLQISTGELNSAVASINQFIAAREGALESEEGDKIPSFTITLAEMEQIERTKAVVLALVHLKRLDIGSVDGSKVYKVKRF